MPFLDNGYTVFGEVVSGLEVIDAICAVPTESGDKLSPVTILSVKSSNSMFDQIDIIQQEVNQFSSKEL